MLDIEDFSAVFHNTTYSNAVIGEIIQHKKTLGGKTFFERLLELLQIKWRRIYPPTSKDALAELHSRIISAPISLHYKHCLFFYLLKDLSPSYRSSEVELAAGFAANVHLENKFVAFVEGLWALDHLQCQTAVGYLTHPSIIPTFPDEILLVLLQQCGGKEDGRENILPTAYYNCANPPLTDKETRTEWVKYMTDRNVTSTLYWIRERPEFEQESLLQLLVGEILEPSELGNFQSVSTSSTMAEEELYTREEKAMEFVGLLLTEEEEGWVESFLTEGKGRSLKGAVDTLQMRRIATGKLKEYADDGAAKGRRYGNMNWEVLREGMKRGLGPRREDEFVV